MLIKGFILEYKFENIFCKVDDVWDFKFLSPYNCSGYICGQIELINDKYVKQWSLEKFNFVVIVYACW